MGSLNNAHQENGGVLLYSGELILLYSDAVDCGIKDRGHAKGRIYLTTHRVVFTSTPLKQNANLKSFSAPFFSMFDLSLDQPIFGANAIKGKVHGDPEFSFDLKFNKGGAIEFGQAMRNAARQAATMAQQSGFTAPPPYSPPAAASYYQASDDVYQPNYPVGFVLPTQNFPDAPPPGFVYTSDVPPPYPGLITATTVTAQVPGAAVHPNPAQLMFGQSSVTPAIYHTATTQYVVSPMDPYAAGAGASMNPQFQNAPAGPGFNIPGMDVPPSYGEATKKKQ